MTEDIGHFHVKITGEVDAASIETNFEKTAKKMGKSLSKHLSMASEMLSGKTFSMSQMVRGGLQKGAEVGGFVGLVAKIGLLIAAVKVVSDAIMSLAPIQAILKMITTVLQLTLYPLAQFFLTILKPIMGMLLKYLILPFYYNVMPVLTKMGTDIGESVTIIGGVLAAISNFANPIALLSGIPIFEMVGAAWNSLMTQFGEGWNNLFAGISSAFSGFATYLGEGWKAVSTVVINALQGFKNWLFMSWTEVPVQIRKPLEDFITWLTNIWNGISAKISGPLNTAKTWLSDVWGGVTDAILAPLRNAWNWIQNKMNRGSVDSRPWVTSSSEADSHPWMAEGGIVNRPTIAMIGERGPEAVIPLSKMNKFGGGTTVNNVFNIGRIEKDVDIDDIVKKIERTFYAHSKRSGVI